MDGEGWTPVGERIFRQLEELTSLRVKVGFQDDVKEKKRQGKGKKGTDNTDAPLVAQVAAWNEFGTVNMPSRPFMRKSIDNNKDAMADYMRELAAGVMDRSVTAQNALKEIGLKQKDFMQLEIDNGNFAPNAASTIRKKGSSHPLVDSGTMRASINYVIEKK